MKLKVSVGSNMTVGWEVPKEEQVLSSAVLYTHYYQVSPALWELYYEAELPRTTHPGARVSTKIYTQFFNLSSETSPSSILPREKVHSLSILNKKDIILGGHVCRQASNFDSSSYQIRVLIQSYQSRGANRNSSLMVCSLGKTLLIQLPQAEKKIRKRSECVRKSLVGQVVARSQPWAEDLPCLMLTNSDLKSVLSAPLRSSLTCIRILLSISNPHWHLHISSKNATGLWRFHLMKEKYFY